MPPLRKFKKEDIINIACDIVKNEGIEAINARRIAKELNCSVQPIFHNFENMEELKKEVNIKIYDTYKKYLLNPTKDTKPYKAMGLSYIKFAKDYPEFFKIIFMKKTDFNAEKFIMYDEIGDDVIKTGQTFTGLSYEEQKQFHIKVWMFTHGIACLVASQTINFTDEEISNLISDTVQEILIGYKNKGGEK